VALDNNEIVFLATTYDSFSRVIDSLASAGISVNNETNEGNLIIQDSVKTYQIDVQGAFKFARRFINRAMRDGKRGIFNISDLDNSLWRSESRFC